jgi:hypothetical protein
MAMVVSDAGLASTEPEWWNGSPMGCMLIAIQPRGGWQVMQRAVQWGNDHWARSFGVNCKLPVLYCYFACSMRNRLEVWDSPNFISPMEGVEGPVEEEAETAAVPAEPDVLSPAATAVSETETDTREDAIEMKPVARESEMKPMARETDMKGKDCKVAERPHRGDNEWKQFNQHNVGRFTVRRPTKLVDGSRGGQAFMCSLLCPVAGNAYSVEEQARLQFLSIVLVVAGLIKSKDYYVFMQVIQEDFEVSTRLGAVFRRLVRVLFFANWFVISFIVSVFYALWSQNIYGDATPYILQLCSLTTWAFGATGLLMLGGNPRVEIDSNKGIPKHIKGRIDALPSDFVELQFGSLHGSVFTQDRGACFIHKDVVESVCSWNLVLKRGWAWHACVVWFALHIGTSVALQVAGSRVSTIYSQILGIAVLVSTSVVRGMGVSGPEKWMIPQWKMRKHATYAVALQGQITSRSK